MPDRRTYLVQDTLEQQRTAADDLRNMVSSIDVAMLFLDAELRIRFFTPATKSLFDVSETDVGRPIADLTSLAADARLSEDARLVIDGHLSVAHEVETATGVWCRRIVPYRTHHGGVSGVVITFNDVTERKRAAAKAHFLAAASHDLRQPLQTLTLLQGLLSKHVQGTEAADLVVKLENTVDALSGMLNTLLDVEPIEANGEATAWLVHNLLNEKMQVPRMNRSSRPARSPDAHVIFVVDDDQKLRSVLRSVLEDDGRMIEDFATSEAFLASYTPGSDGCLLVDAYLPGMGGLELLQYLRAQSDLLPTIMMTGSSDVPMAVQAMRAGAADFIEKPISGVDLLGSIDHALERSRDTSKQLAWQANAAKHVAELTPRQLEIMNLVLAGHPSKNIAADLGISQRTVENHRASVMRATGARSVPALVRLALAASMALESATAVSEA